MDKAKKCVSCGEEATVWVSLVVHGRVVTKAYCRDHAEAEGFFDPQGFHFLEPTSKQKQKPTTAAGATPHAKGIAGTRMPQCETCGFSFRDFERKGRFGCPDCYTHFIGGLRPYLKKMHHGVIHVGKIPRKSVESHQLETRIRHLEDKLRKAVAGERYEDAAVYRDQIAEARDKVNALRSVPVDTDPVTRHEDDAGSASETD